MKTKKKVQKKVSVKEKSDSYLDRLSESYVVANDSEQYQRGRADAYMCLVHQLIGLCPQCNDEEETE